MVVEKGRRFEQSQWSAYRKRERGPRLLPSKPSPLHVQPHLLGLALVSATTIHHSDSRLATSNYRMSRAKAESSDQCDRLEAMSEALNLQ